MPWPEEPNGNGTTLELRQYYHDNSLAEYWKSSLANLGTPGAVNSILDRFGITAELTSTTRVGFHKYTFSNKKQKSILIKLNGANGPCKIIEGKIKKINAHKFSGYVTNASTRRRPKETPVFFYIELSEPVKDLITWQKNEITEKSKGVEGMESGALLVFDDDLKKEIFMKVGISYCNEEEAKNEGDMQVYSSIFTNGLQVLKVFKK